MKISISTNPKAPEQTRVRINGRDLPQRHKAALQPHLYTLSLIPHNEGVALVRRVLFKPLPARKHFTLCKQYQSEGYAWLNQTRQGVATYQDALAMLHQWRKQALACAGEKLLNGDFMPMPQFTIKSKLYGG